MGAKSTVDISRAEALRIIYEMLETASNEAVGVILEILSDDVDSPEAYFLTNFHVTDQKADHYDS